MHAVDLPLLKGKYTVMRWHHHWISFHLPGPHAKWILYPMSQTVDFEYKNRFACGPGRRKATQWWCYLKFLIVLGIKNAHACCMAYKIMQLNVGGEPMWPPQLRFAYVPSITQNKIWILEMYGHFSRLIQYGPFVKSILKVKISFH